MIIVGSGMHLRPLRAVRFHSVCMMTRSASSDSKTLAPAIKALFVDTLSLVGPSRKEPYPVAALDPVHGVDAMLDEEFGAHWIYAKAIGAAHISNDRTRGIHPGEDV